jgi:hypothetical protein
MLGPIATASILATARLSVDGERDMNDIFRRRRVIGTCNRISLELFINRISRELFINTSCEVWAKRNDVRDESEERGGHCGLGRRRYQGKANLFGAS